jgi:cytochrome c
MRARGGVWTEAKLDQFIKNPQAAVPGTAMEFAGIEDAATRAKIIDYLKRSR